MNRPISLRARLTLIILLPLLAIAVLVGFWQLDTARATAADVFDRQLLSAALAVSNDVTLSGGDALSPRTEELLENTSGGRVFYHVYAPDGVIVAGYATPPVGIPSAGAEESGPTQFEATYLGRDVSGVRLQNRAEIDGFSGVFTTTVWQDTTVRDAFVGQLAGRSLAASAALIASVALIVWFGVNLGLRPLLDLQDAIEARSSDDLGAIRRPVPKEVEGIVGRLNGLFDQVTRSMAAQNEFISNAAHQLRNPIAGVLALAEAVRKAPDHGEAIARSDDLLAAAQNTAELTQQLLTLERAKSLSPTRLQERVDLAEVIAGWMPSLQAAAGPDTHVRFVTDGRNGTLAVDATMLREALLNLVDNAKRHGGPGMTEVEIALRNAGDHVDIIVSDNGAGIAPENLETATRRFSQVSPAEGSGLGLPIVAAVVEAHGGRVNVVPGHPGLVVRLSLPRDAGH
ncbi:MAG: sensor histidine kinase [Pseudomonadota bacterium]